MTTEQGYLQTAIVSQAASGQGFESTHWTVILQAARAESADARAAFGRIYQRYWHPVYIFVRRRGATPEVAEDRCQDFFIDLLRRDAFMNVRPEHGRFRCFLLAALRNFLANVHDRDQARKRGGGSPHLSLDADGAEQVLARSQAHTDPDLMFDGDWARLMISRAFDRLKADYEQAGRGALFEAIGSFLWGGSNLALQAEIAARHRVTANAVSVAIHRLRRHYGEALREEIEATVQDPTEVMDEIRHLLKAVEHQPQTAQGPAPITSTP